MTNINIFKNNISEDNEKILHYLDDIQLSFKNIPIKIEFNNIFKTMEEKLEIFLQEKMKSNI